MGIVIALLAAAACYGRGWFRDRRRADRWRLAAFLGGLVLLGLALLSPIDELSNWLFVMHMVQHLLLVMLAPPLLLLADPLLYIQRGLPAAIRRSVGRLFAPASAGRRVVRGLTAPGRVWVAFIAVFLGWHDPLVYDAALRSEPVHVLEHLTFLGTALLYWQHVTGAAPHLHAPLTTWQRVVYLLITVPPTMLAGVGVAFARAPIYSHYVSLPRLWGLSVLQDQRLGGALMWIGGGMMLLLAALVLIARFARAEASTSTKYAGVGGEVG